VEGVHDFFDGGVPVPVVEVVDVDVVGAQVFQAGVDGVAEGLGAVTSMGSTGDGVVGEVVVVAVL
jgi:hypothetical protein